MQTPAIARATLIACLLLAGAPAAYALNPALVPPAQQPVFASGTR